MSEPNTTAPSPRPSLWATLARLLGMGVYKLTVRLAVNTVTALLALYFLINSSAVAHFVGERVSQQIHGRVVVEHIRWGPNPGRLRLLKPQVYDDAGVSLLEAKWVRIRADWLTLLKAAIAGDFGQELIIQEVEFAKPTLKLANDDAGLLTLAKALSPVTSRAPTKGASDFRLSLPRIRVTDATVRYELPAMNLDLEGLSASASFRFNALKNLPPSFQYQVTNLVAKKLKMFFPSWERDNIAQLPVVSVAAISVTGDGAGVRTQGLSLRGDKTQALHAQVRVSTPRTEGALMTVHVDDVALTTRSDEPMVRSLLGPDYAATVTFQGDVRWSSDGRLVISADTVAAGTFAKVKLQKATGRLRLEMGADPKRRMKLTGRDLNLSLYGGQAKMGRMVYTLDNELRSLISGDVDLSGIRLEEVLSSDIVGLSGALVTLSSGGLSGALQTSLNVQPEAEGRPANSDLKISGKLTLDRGEEAEPASFRRLHWAGGLRLRSNVGGVASPLILSMDDWRLSDRLDAAGLPSLKSGAAAINTNGDVDLTAQTMEVTASLALPRLEDVLTPMGIKQIRGGLRLSEAKLTGPWLNPTFSGGMHVDKIDAYGQKLTSGRGRLSVAKGQVKLQEMRLNMPLGHIAGALTLELFGDDLTQPLTTPRMTTDGLSVHGVDLAGLLEPMGVDWLSGQLFIDRCRLSMALKDPIATATGGAYIRMRSVRARYERFREVQAQVRLRKGAVRLSDVKMQLAPVGLAAFTKGVKSPVIEASRIDYDFNRKQYQVNGLRWPLMPFGRIGEVAALKMPLTGEIGGEFKRITGDLRDLSLDGELQFSELAWGAIYMGAAKVTMRKRRGSSAVLDSGKFFPRFSLLSGSRVHFRRLVPTWMQFFMRTRKLDPMDFLGLPPLNDMRMLATGRAEVRLDFRRGQPIFSVLADLPTGGAELELGTGLDTLANRRPTRIQVLPDRVKIGSLLMALGKERLELCGDFIYPNEARKRPSILDLYLAGGIEIPRIGALAESFASMNLRVRIERDKAVSAQAGAKCLKTIAGRRGSMHLYGPMDRLLPQGKLRLVSARMTPRGYGKEIILKPGAVIGMTRLKTGSIRLTVDESKRVDGQIDEGRFSTWGQLEMGPRGLERVNWQFEGVDLAHTVPKEYSVVAATRLTFNGTDLNNKRRRSMKLAGKVKITEGSYSKSFDRLGRVISGVRGRELASYSKPLTESMPWLSEMKLDLDVDGTNFLVLSRFPFGKTDLELGLDLKVNGTWGAMRIFDRVEIQPGSILTYSVVKRDFEVTRGTIDFSGDPMKGVIDIEAKSEVELQTGASAGVNSTMSVGPNLAGTGSASMIQKVTVLIRISGPLDDPSKLDIQLDSVPAYQQGDIQSLILTGQLLTSASNSVAGGFGSRSSINLLTDDLAKAFSDILLSAFVDKVSVGIPVAGGGITANIQTSLGKYLSLGGDFYSQGSEVRSTGRFTFLLPFEGLFLESLLISTRGSNSTQTQNIFEGRIRYRMRLAD